MSSNTRSYARVRIFTKTTTVLLDSEINSDLMAVTTKKDISGSGQSFSIVVSPRFLKQLADGPQATPTIHNLIQPYDLVEISLKVDETGYKVEMIGFVSRATVTLKVGDGGVPQRNLTIMGFGMDRALQMSKVFFNPYAFNESMRGAGGIYYYTTPEAQKIFQSRNVVDFAKALVNMAFDNSLNKSNQSPFFGITFGNSNDNSGLTDSNQVQGLKMQNLVDFQGGMSTVFNTNTINNTNFLTEMYAGPERNLWDLLMMYTDPPFHECFIDLRRNGTYDYADTKYSSSTTVSKETQYNADVTHHPLTFDIDGAEKTHAVGKNGNQANVSPLVLYVRTTPFSPDTWGNLNQHTFSTADVIETELASSDENVFNYFITLPTFDSVISGIGAMPIIASCTWDDSLNLPKVPIYDRDSIAKFGLRRFPAEQTKFVDFISKDITGQFYQTGLPTTMTIAKPCATLARQLLRWYSFGEDFETGFISLKGRVGIGPNGATIGSRLVEYGPSGSPTGKEYYIEGITQNWQVGTPLSTSLTVTRGHYPANRFPKVTDLCKKLNLDQLRVGNSSVFFPIEPEDSSGPSMVSHGGSSTQERGPI